MARVLFINPVVREEDKPRHVPYGMALLASIAMEQGHLVQVFDANAWRAGDDVLRQVLRADDWDVVAIGGLTTTYGYVKKACRIIEEEVPESLLVLGGGLLTSMPREIMTWLPEVDLGVVGEAFVTFPEVLGLVDRGERDFETTPGVCRRDADGTPRLNEARPLIPDLDVLPHPAWDLFPLDIYFDNSADLFSEEIFTSRRRMDVNGSLGCSLICRYCWHLGTTGDMVIAPDPKGENEVHFSYGRNIRYHSARYIVDMVKELVRRYDVDFVSFIDENMMTMHVSSGKKWLHELSSLWIEEGLQPTCRRDGVAHDEGCRGVHWAGTSHAGLARLDVLEHMHAAGCSHLVYGIESFDPGVLKRLGKGSTRETNLRGVRECLKSGIRPIPNIILGFPEESFESIQNTMEGMVELGIHAKPHFATPYPGSEWYYTYRQSIEEQYGGDLEQYVLALGDASSITAVISHTFSGVELLGLQEIMYRRDFRLLEQARTHAEANGKRTRPVAVARENLQFIRKKTRAPVAPSPARR